MKRSAPTVLVLASLALAILPACKSMSSEELKASIEVLDYTSVWVSKYYQPWPPRLILDHHTVCDRRVAGSHQGAGALHFDHADPAVAGRFEIRAVAQRRNLDAGCPGSL